MDFFNDLGKTLSNVAKKAEVKSGELLETGRQNVEILKEEDAVRKAYRKIGERIYEEYEKGESYAGKADELCEGILRRKNRIDDLKAKLNEAKKEEKKAEQRPEESGDREDPEEEPAESEDGSDTEEEERQENAGEPELSYFEAVEKMKKGNDGD